MYLQPGDNHWAIDIEGDDILPGVSVIWCMVAINILSGEEVRLVGHDAIKAWFTERNKEKCWYIAHNGLGYDGPALNQILDVGLSPARLIDTMLLSMVFQPSLSGGHGLEAWGERLRFPKTGHTDFSRFSQEMLEYCSNDTQLCRRVYLYLIRKLRGLKFTEVSLEIEHLSWLLIKKQQARGVKFDLEGAHVLYAKVREVQQQLQDEIYKYWPPELQIVKHFKQARKKDGSYTKNYENHLEQYVRLQEDNQGGYYAYDYVEFNIGSPMQRVEKLLELGWEPREFTKETEKGGGGNPKVTDSGQLVPSLLEFIDESGKEEVKLIARWIDINARGNMINNWIEECNDDTGFIHGSLWLANTYRYKHSGPNTANIPAVRLDKEDRILRGLEGVFTYEARNLWTVRADDRVLVGVDAKGIQLRVLANYLNNPTFTEAILSEDPHAYNRDAWGFEKGKPGRALAKTIIYATLMGAGDARIASEAKISLQEAKEAKALFFDRVPEFPNLLKRLKQQFKKTGRIQLCDGSSNIPPKDYMVIPYLLQGDEARIMRKAAILADRYSRQRGLDVMKVLDVHDEWQNDVLEAHSVEFAKVVCPQAFKEAGEFFRYNLPIECDAQIGKTWAETH